MQPATESTVLGDFDDATLSTATATYRIVYRKNKPVSCIKITVNVP
jgi:hypothetical protein